MTSLTLRVFTPRLAVCRLPSGAHLPHLAIGGAFFSLTITPDEISIVCEEELAPQNAVISGGWRALQVAGELDFSLTGILTSLANPLADAGISLFAMSTYNTDYLLVREENLAQAISVLRAAGHSVEQ